MKLGIFILILFLLGAVVGYMANDMYRYIFNKRDYNGLWIDENITHSQAIETASKYDNIGDWICVNIKGMSIKEMIETCEHESAHEIFAEYCEDNATKCLEAVK